jgi:hypothetical protein
VTEYPSRRLYAHAPAGQRRHEGPDLDLIAGCLDGIASDAEDEQYSHNTEVRRHALQEVSEVEPSGEDNRA